VAPAGLTISLSPHKSFRTRSSRMMRKKELRTAAKRRRKAVNIPGGKAGRNAVRRRKAEMRKAKGRRS
jgi:hypothetical protein